MSIWKAVQRHVRRLVAGDSRLAMLRRCAEGVIPIPIALMNLAHATAGAAEMETLIRRALGSRRLTDCARRRLRDLERLLATHPNAHDIVRKIDAVFSSGRENITETEHWASRFDRGVAVSPEASVAVYSFGDRALLHQITEELVEKLFQWGVVGPGVRVLDYGCGFGRVAGRLAERAASIVGVDASSGMLREARVRLAGTANVELMNLADFQRDRASASFDLVLLVDVCPYFSEPVAALSKLAERLAPGGNLIVMNWSYSLGLAKQQEQARRLARLDGLTLIREGNEEFSLWDGRVFQFLKPTKEVVLA